MYLTTLFLADGVPPGVDIPQSNQRALTLHPERATPKEATQMGTTTRRWSGQANNSGTETPAGCTGKMTPLWRLHNIELRTTLLHSQEDTGPVFS